MNKISSQTEGDGLSLIEKDVEEIALELLLFGTSPPITEKDTLTTKTHNEEKIEDEDLFVIDTLIPREGEIRAQKKRVAIWHDEEDDRTQVDISKINRLKKLRTTEDETNISSIEYQKRLKNQ